MYEFSFLALKLCMFISLANITPLVEPEPDILNHSNKRQYIRRKYFNIRKITHFSFKYKIKHDIYTAYRKI